MKKQFALFSVLMILVMLVSLAFQVTSSQALAGTYFTGTDNENNAHTGAADGDMDVEIYNNNPLHPIEFNINVPVGGLPTTDAYLTVRAFDVDEEQGQKDEVFLNGTSLGFLSGTNNTWNTSAFLIPAGTLVEGNNLVQINVDTLNPGLAQWLVVIDWGQVVVDGGVGTPGRINSITVTDYSVAGGNITLDVDVEIEALANGTFTLETNIYDPSANNVDADTQTGIAMTAGQIITRPVQFVFPEGANGDVYAIRSFLFDEATGLLNNIKSTTWTYTLASYTVTFDGNGGGTPSPTSKTVTVGSPYGTLATVSRAGYTFNGWYNAASGGNLVTDATVVTTASDHTLYAQWTAGTYTVTFDGNGGGTPSPTSKSVTFGSPYGTLATISRAGYTFNGWYNAASGGTPVTAATVVTTASDHSLYAQWTALTGPDKIAPANAAVGVSLSPTLSWNSMNGATSYEYCYSSAPGPCTKWNSVGTNTSVALSGLAHNYTYYWQVRAITGSGAVEADSGAWWSFTTTTTAACTWPAYTPPTSPTFLDVPMTVPHWSWVERLYNATITATCGNGNFCPNNDVSRASTAILLLRAKHCGSSYVPPAVGSSTGFNDVPLTATYAPWVKQLAAEGITAGCGNGNFCPLELVNRAQMAIFLLRAKHGSTYSPPAVGATTGFGDVPLSATYAAWVKQLAADGITAGCGGGNFCPLTSVPRAQMAIFIVRAFGLP